MHNQFCDPHRTINKLNYANRRNDRNYHRFIVSIDLINKAFQFQFYTDHLHFFDKINFIDSFTDSGVCKLCKFQRAFKKHRLLLF